MARLIAAMLILTTILAACSSDDAPDEDGTPFGGGATATASATVAAPGSGGVGGGGGGGGGGGDGGDPVEGPCALVSDETMSGLLSVDVTGVTIDPTLCEYAPNDGEPGQDLLGADLFSNTAFDAECSLEFDNTGRGDPVDGVGVEASWKGNEAGSIGTAQLLLCTGDEFMTITLYVPADRTEDMLAVARSVAEAALASR
jgi:hypothetical protein